MNPAGQGPTRIRKTFCRDGYPPEEGKKKAKNRGGGDQGTSDGEQLDKPCKGSQPATDMGRAETDEVKREETIARYPARKDKKNSEPQRMTKRL